MLDHSMQPERNKTIDAIKGFAIILVVLAHAIERNIIDSESNMENHSEKAGHVIVEYSEALSGKPRRTFDS